MTPSNVTELRSHSAVGAQQFQEINASRIHFRPGATRLNVNVILNKGHRYANRELLSQNDLLNYLVPWNKLYMLLCNLFIDY